MACAQLALQGLAGGIAREILVYLQLGDALEAGGDIGIDPFAQRVSFNLG